MIFLMDGVIFRCLMIIIFFGNSFGFIDLLIGINGDYSICDSISVVIKNDMIKLVICSGVML